MCPSLPNVFLDDSQMWLLFLSFFFFPFLKLLDLFSEAAPLLLTLLLFLAVFKEAAVRSLSLSA